MTTILCPGSLDQAIACNFRDESLDIRSGDIRSGDMRSVVGRFFRKGAFASFFTAGLDFLGLGVDTAVVKFAVSFSGKRDGDSCFRIFRSCELFLIDMALREEDGFI